MSGRKMAALVKDMGWTEEAMKQAGELLEAWASDQSSILREALERIAEGAISARDAMALARDALLRAGKGEERSKSEERRIAVQRGMPPAVPGAYHPPFTPQPEERWQESTDPGLEMLTDYCINLGQAYSRGQFDLEVVRDYIKDAISTFANPAPKPEGRSCEWYDNGEMWKGSCGIAWWMSNDESLEGNEMRYCPKCGKPIHETPVASEGEGEEPKKIDGEMREWVLDRYHKGQRMAEGARVNARSLEEAIKRAHRLFQGRDYLDDTFEERP